MKIHTNSMNSYNRPKGYSVSKDMELEYCGGAAWLGEGRVAGWR